VKSHLDNDSFLPIYETIPAICNTPRQTQFVRNSIFPHFVMVLRDVCRVVVSGCVLVRHKQEKYSENYFDVGIIVVEISRAGLTTTVFLFFLS